MARAYEAGFKQRSGQDDIAAELLAQTIVRLAKHGERDPHSARAAGGRDHVREASGRRWVNADVSYAGRTASRL